MTNKIPDEQPVGQTHHRSQFSSFVHDPPYKKQDYPPFLLTDQSFIYRVDEASRLLTYRDKTIKQDV